MGFYSTPDEKDRWAKEIVADFKGIGNVVVTIKDEAVGTMDQLKVAINLNMAKIADFTFVTFPHSNDAIVSVSTYVESEYRRRGISTILHKHKRRIAKDLGYSIILATVRNDNKEQIGSLKKSKWKMLWDMGDTSLWSISTTDKFYF